MSDPLNTLIMVSEPQSALTTKLCGVKKYEEKKQMKKNWEFVKTYISSVYIVSKLFRIPKQFCVHLKETNKQQQLFHKPHFHNMRSNPRIIQIKLPFF